MKKRPYWIDRINKAWKKRPIVWLSGVRRVGKTTLATMLDNSVYLNCDLPSTSRRLKDPELFFRSVDKGSTVIFDEIHRLPDPSLVLKIAADVYPHLRILATGSSTLAATAKFRDSLTGRKAMVYLPPVLWRECGKDFSVNDLDHRLLNGGLPESLLSQDKNNLFFSEWMDSYYARDIQELFSIRSRSGFLKLLQLLMLRSGGLVGYTQLAKSSEMSRPTVKTYLESMEIAHALYLLPPFHGGGKREIIRRPKCYAFDTGFVTFVKGWETIREDDRGILWEHLVLDALRVDVEEKGGDLYYWQDKSQREIDFVIKRSRKQVDTVECKINPDSFAPQTLKAFRELYPNGRNYIISPVIVEPYRTRYDRHLVEFIGSVDDL